MTWREHTLWPLALLIRDRFQHGASRDLATPNYLPKAPLLNTIYIMGIKASIYELGGGGGHKYFALSKEKGFWVLWLAWPLLSSSLSLLPGL